MNTLPPPSESQHEPDHYEIRLRGYLDNRWANWFEGLTITQNGDGETRLTGAIVDQAALYGLLKKVRDIGLPLIAVNRVNLNDPNDHQTTDRNHPTEGKEHEHR
jgi:hypothetical protein